ncbi:MAG: hypothetical protein PHD07_06460 [Bacteroidales bacterium]|nr:hypothetical protein [Bacteroidales bacterium]
MEHYVKAQIGLKREYMWRRLSYEEVVEAANHFLQGRTIFSLSKEEMDEIVKWMILETSATLSQISAVLHVSYEYLKRFSHRI